MTKRDVIWLLIRIGGLYFVWQGIESLLNLFTTFVAVSSTPALLANSIGILLQSVLLTGIYITLGLYMLSNGSFFYHVLSRQPDRP